MDLLRQYVYYEPSRAIPEHIQLVHIDENPWQIGKNYPAEVGVIGDTRESLLELFHELNQSLSREQKNACLERHLAWTQKHSAAREEFRARVKSQKDIRPLTPLGLMGALSKILPPDVAVIEEAVTTTNTTFERLGVLKNTTGYFGHRGWALGWGLGVSIGVKMAWPDRPVLALLGEGAAMYGIQGLWSAAKYKIPVVFVICNNAQYQILKIGARGLNLPQANAGKFEGMDLVGPEIDYVFLARSLGIEARRIENPDELCAAVTAAWKANDKPVLFDVPISRETQSRLNYG
jgi:benzoylformate decarboxylase